MGRKARGRTPARRSPSRGRARAPGVEEEAHLDARGRARGERLGEALAGAIAPEDVRLEADRALGAGDGLEHGRVGLGAVLEERDAVGADGHLGEGGLGGREGGLGHAARGRAPRDEAA